MYSVYALVPFVQYCITVLATYIYIYGLKVAKTVTVYICMYIYNLYIIHKHRTIGTNGPHTPPSRRFIRVFIA